ncbi:MAG: helix-turn-helix domain-containing protein [Bacteroidia bacterium]|nr:helix-turn-helix domain-containing protein [Bacteroidia bacterium]
MANHTTPLEQKIASDSIHQFRAVSNKLEKSKNETVEIQIEGTKQSIKIPKSAFSFLADILAQMAEGKSITVLPTDSELSSQQAADFIQVSRPFLVKLLEQGKIPFRKVGRHRRIRLMDLMNFEKIQKLEREKQLEFLAKQAQELNMGYE